MDEYLVLWQPQTITEVDGEKCVLKVTVGLWKPRNVNQEYHFSITCEEKVIELKEQPAFSPHLIYCVEYDDGLRHWGCDHEYICKYFPELKPFVDLHLADRFGVPFGGYNESIQTDHMTEDEIAEIKHIFRKRRIRHYLHAREFINFIRERSTV